MKSLRRTLPLFALSLLSAYALPLRAQSAPAAGSSSAAPAGSAAPDAAHSVPVFSSRTQLVMIPVVVTRDGKHVTGLKSEDFRVEEHGKPRTPTVFEEVASVAPETKTRAALPASGHSNFTFGNTDSWRVTLVLMDTLNTPVLRQEAARREMIRYLGKNLRRGEPTALLGLSGSGLRQLYPLTQDTSVLIAALQKLHGVSGADENNENSAQLTGDMTASLDNNSVSQSADIISQFLQDSEATMAAFQQRNSIRTTLAALKQIAQAYAAIPGRKTLLWASGGVPFTIDDPQSFERLGTDMQQRYEETWRALSAAGIAVYPVDVNGLKGISGSNSFLDVERRSGANIPSSRGAAAKPMSIQYDKDAERQETLRSIAAATGGIPCINNNDLAHCFEHAVDDSRQYYMLGYYLPADDQKPGWRKLKVKVNAPGAHVQARDGFYLSAPQQETPQTVQHELTEALSSPVEFTGVRVNVREATVPSGIVPEPGKLHREFAVGMPARTLTMNEPGNFVDVTVIALALDARGNNRGQGDNRVSGSLKPETAGLLQRSGMAIGVGVDLAPGSYEMRFAVRDNLNGAIGTVVFPIDVK